MFIDERRMQFPIYMEKTYCWSISIYFMYLQLQDNVVDLNVNRYMHMFKKIIIHLIIKCYKI